MQSEANRRGQAAAAAWEADAIEACRNDPEVAALGLCYVCMCSHPCLCDDDIIVGEMLAYFKRNPKGDIERAKSRSWGMGEPVTELMRGLKRIAEDGLKAAKEQQGLSHDWQHENGTGWKPKQEPPKAVVVPTAETTVDSAHWCGDQASAEYQPWWRRFFS